MATLLRDDKVTQEYIQTLRETTEETKVSEEVKVVLEIISITQLQRFLMHLENKMLSEEMEGLKNQKSKFLLKPTLNALTDRARQYLSPRVRDNNSGRDRDLPPVASRHERINTNAGIGTDTIRTW